MVVNIMIGASVARFESRKKKLCKVIYKKIMRNMSLSID